jgi:16S rRNA processing protein RimM
MVRKLATATLGAPHGVHGFQAVRSLSGETDHLFRLTEVELRDRSGARRQHRTVAEMRSVGAKMILRFADVQAPEQARQFSGWVVWVPRGQASGLAAGEYYVADLCGCSVYQCGRSRGVVSDLIAAGGDDVLEVTEPTGATFLVPFRERFVPGVDILARRIDLADEYERP